MSKKLGFKDRIDSYCMDELEKEQIRKLVEKIVDVFDGFGLLPRDMNADDINNLSNAKRELVELFNSKIDLDKFLEENSNGFSNREGNKTGKN